MANRMIFYSGRANPGKKLLYPMESGGISERESVFGCASANFVVTGCSSIMDILIIFSWLSTRTGNLDSSSNGGERLDKALLPPMF